MCVFFFVFFFSFFLSLGVLELQTFCGIRGGRRKKERILDIGPPCLDCYWVGSLDFNSLVEIKLGFSDLNPQQVKLLENDMGVLY